jgi:ubiquinone/menaquinone biosynthesis C-methylase UbiE
VSPAPRNQAAGDAVTILPPAEGYERWASSYDATPNPLLALEERGVMPLLPPVRRQRVLDLCCGTGRWLRILAAHIPALLVGVDASAAMLSIANRGFRQLVRADCRELPFAEKFFDFVICSFAAGHIAELGVFARECARILKPNGRLFVTDLHPHAYAQGWRTGFRDSQGAVQIRTVSHPWYDSVQLFSSAGLGCAAMHEFHFASAEHRIFFQAGKKDFFAQAASVPAVLLCHFWRRN